jgi:hypothetical protein
MATSDDQIGNVNPQTQYPLSSMQVSSMSGTSTPTDVLYLTEPGNASAISVTDINQGEIGDCFMLADLAELALFKPSAISDMIKSDGGGTYTVDLYAEANGSLPGYGYAGPLVMDPQTVTTAEMSPDGVNSNTFATTANGQAEIWPQIIETAFAQLNGGFGAIANGGYPYVAMEELTGQNAASPWLQSVTSASLAAYMAAGDLVVLGTGAGADPAVLVTSHAYALEGLQSIGGASYVDLYNPWGNDQPSPIAVSQLSADFEEIDVGKSLVSTLAPQTPVLQVQAPDQRIGVDVGFEFTLSASSYQDPDGGSVSYAATGTGGAALPAWLHFDANTDTFSGTAVQGGLVQTVVVTATTAEGASAAEAFHIYTASSVPTFEIQQGDVRATADTTFSFALPGGSFAPPPGQTITYSASQPGGQLPAWLSFNAVTQTFSGTTPQQSGVQTVDVMATSSTNGTAEEAFHIYTTAQAPVLLRQEGDQRLTAGSAFSFGLPSSSYADPNGGTVSYQASLTSGAALPSWLTFNSANDQFSGRLPTGQSDTAVMITATTSEGTVAAEAFNIYAQAPAPTFLAQAPDERVGTGQAFSFSLPSPSYSDPQGGMVSLSAMSADLTALPSWMSFNSTTDVFSGTTPTTSGSAAIRVDAVTPSGGSAAEAFHIYYSNPALVSSTAPSH